MPLRTISITEQPQLRIISGAANLSFLNQAAAVLIGGSVETSLGSRTGTTAFTGPIVSLQGASSVPQGLPLTPPATSRLVLRTAQALPSTATYELRLSFPVQVRVNAAVVGPTISLTSADLDVRSVLVQNQFDIGDVRRARYTSVRISPMNNPVFSQRVTRVTIRATTTSNEGTPVSLGTFTPAQLNDFVPVDANVLEIIRRTGRIRLLVTLDVSPGPALDANALSFTLAAKLRVEVPQPSTTGGA